MQNFAPQRRFFSQLEKNGCAHTALFHSKGSSKTKGSLVELKFQNVDFTPYKFLGCTRSLCVRRDVAFCPRIHKLRALIYRQINFWLARRLFCYLQNKTRTFHSKWSPQTLKRKKKKKKEPLILSTLRLRQDRATSL
ncbi:unnamed protein product [Ixodes pacificus]